MILILSIICIYILVQTYYYLKQANECQCFMKNDEKYGINIEYMKFFQILHIALFVIFVFWGLLKPTLTIPKFGENIISTQILVALLFVYGYMFYNVLNFYRNVKSDCKCVDKNMYKYFVYFEGISSFMSVLQIIYSFALVVIIMALHVSK